MKTNKITNVLTWVAFGVILAIVLFTRWRLLAFPLERDEGEYALTGQMFLQGFGPFEAVYNMKLPGAGLLYAFWMAIFGQTTQGIHIGLLLTTALSGYFLFQISRHWLGSTLAAWMTVVLTELIWVTPNVLGFAAHATHFLNLFAFAGIWALIRWQGNQRMGWLLGSGLLLGMAFLMKQHALFFLLFGLGMAGYTMKYQLDWTWKKILGQLFLLGVMMSIPYLLVVVWIAATGTFDTFWFWTVDYGAAYINQTSWEQFSMSLTTFWEFTTKRWETFWLLGIAGFVTLFWLNIEKKHKVAIGLFGFCSLLSVLPGFHLRPHYFITLLPALCLLGVGAVQFFQQKLAASNNKWSLALPLLLWVVAMFGIQSQRYYFFSGTPDQLCKITYRNNPFVETREVARYLSSRSAVNDKIAVVCSEPQINFYCKRQGATGVIYGYPITDQQPYNKRIRDLMISEIERNKPRFFVFVNTSGSWAMDGNSDRSIFDWLDQYLKANYKMRGLVDVFDGRNATYHFDEDLSKIESKSSDNIYIFERN